MAGGYSSGMILRHDSELVGTELSVLVGGEDVGPGHHAHRDGTRVGMIGRLDVVVWIEDEAVALVEKLAAESHLILH